MISETFLWHDYETFGRDPARERPVQFAAIRTDQNLEEIDERTMIYCRQTADYLPDPGSCLVHRVLPQTANELGLNELDFATNIHGLMSVSGTCTAGYNSIRFDDEFSRQLFFRNLFDPYSREWQNGNSRWDLIDVVRLARALRPDGIEWPFDADGKPTNKLELLTDANGISHGDAHDALADVHATIELARLLRRKQPKLYDYAYSNRSKHFARQSLNLIRQTPVLHVSGMYPAVNGHLSIVMPLAPHPTNQNGVLIYDLRVDPKHLINLSREAIAERIFTRTADLPQGIDRIAVKTVHTNRCPILAPLATLTKESNKRLNIDVDQAKKHREQILANPSIVEKLAWVFTSQDRTGRDDPELTLYSGSFATNADRQLMNNLHTNLKQNGKLLSPSLFGDDRYGELVFRLLARNRPDLLDDTDHARWRHFCHSRVHLGTDGFRSIKEYNIELDNLQGGAASGAHPQLIQQLRSYGQQIASASKRTDDAL